MNRQTLTQFITRTYGAEPDFPWPEYPGNAVFRHENGKKWFALIMPVGRDKLGLDGDGSIDIVNVKCGPVMAGSLNGKPGFFPAYHMNKTHWISAALDGSADDEIIKMIVDISFEATAKKLPKSKQNKK